MLGMFSPALLKVRCVTLCAPSAAMLSPSLLIWSAIGEKGCGLNPARIRTRKKGGNTKY